MRVYCPALYNGETTKTRERNRGLERGGSPRGPDRRGECIFEGMQNVFQGGSYVTSQNKLNKFENIKTIPSIFSNHQRMLLEINNKKKKRKIANVKTRAPS